MKFLAALLLFATLALFGVAESAQATTGCQFTTKGHTMRLDADCTTDATILVPDGFKLDGQGHTIMAIDPSGGFLGAIVRNEGTTADVRNLVIDTDNLSGCKGGDDRLRGILFEGASGSITNNVVMNINRGLSGCQEGNAIEVRNGPFDGTHPNTQKVNVSGNHVKAYQKTGIVANGDVRVNVRDNEVVGIDLTNSIAQNGIQLGYGATGSVMKNSVDSNWYDGAKWTASGILIFEASDVIVQGNDVSNAQSGIVVETWGWFVAAASNNHVVHNTISGTEYGISVAAYDFPPYSTFDPEAIGNKVTNNDISATGGDTGIYVGSYGAATESESKVTANDIAGFSTPLDLSSGTKAHANVSTP